MRQLMQAEVAKQRSYHGKLEDSCDSRESLGVLSTSCASSTTCSSTRHSFEPSGRATPSGGCCSSSRAHKALLPVLTLAEAEAAIQPIFRGKVEDSCNSLDDSTGYATSSAGSCAGSEVWASGSSRSGASRASFADKKAEREALARVAPRDRLETAALRGIMSSVFTAKPAEQDVLESRPQGSERPARSRGACSAARHLSAARRGVVAARAAEEVEGRQGKLEERLRQLEALNPGPSQGWRHLGATERRL